MGSIILVLHAAFSGVEGHAEEKAVTGLCVIWRLSQSWHHGDLNVMREAGYGMYLNEVMVLHAWGMWLRAALPCSAWAGTKARGEALLRRGRGNMMPAVGARFFCENENVVK